MLYKFYENQLSVFYDGSGRKESDDSDRFCTSTLLHRRNCKQGKRNHRSEIQMYEDDPNWRMFLAY